MWRLMCDFRRRGGIRGCIWGIGGLTGGTLGPPGVIIRGLGQNDFRWVARDFRRFMGLRVIAIFFDCFTVFCIFTQKVLYCGFVGGAQEGVWE